MQEKVKWGLAEAKGLAAAYTRPGTFSSATQCYIDSACISAFVGVYIAGGGLLYGRLPVPFAGISGIMQGLQGKN